MRKHLRVVLAPAERLDPRRRALVPLGAARARDLPVRDVADEHVPERVLLFTADRRAALAPDELLPLERVQRVLCLSAFELADSAHRAEPEDLPEDRRVLQQLLLGRRQPVEPRRDDALHVLRNPKVVAPGLREQPGELLGVQRVPAGAREQRRLRLRREHRALQQLREQARRVVVGERRDRERERVGLAAAPTRPPLEQLGPAPCRRPAAGRPQPSRRGGRRSRAGRRRPSAGLRTPVRSAAARRAPRTAASRPRSAPRGRRPGPRRLPRPTSGRRLSSSCSGAVADEVADHLRKLGLGLLRPVRLEDSRLRFRHLGERPVGHALAVGKRTPLPPVRQLLLGIDDAHRARRPAGSCRFPGTPTSVTSCGERSSRARASASASESSSRRRPTSARSRLDDVGAEPRPRLSRLPDRHRLGLSLGAHRVGLVVVDRRRAVARYVVSSTRTPLTGAALWSRAAVLTTSPAAIPSPSLGRAPRVTSASPVVTAMRTCEPAVVRHRLADRERRADRALGIVLVGDRRAEERPSRRRR